jgi:hypothetical protein
MAIGTYEILVAAPCESVTLLHVGVSSRLSPRLLDQGGVIFLVGGFFMLLWTTPAWVKSSTPRTTFGAVEVDVSESPGRDTGEPRWFGDLPQPFRSAWPCCVHWWASWLWGPQTNTSIRYSWDGGKLWSPTCCISWWFWWANLWKVFLSMLRFGASKHFDQAHHLCLLRAREIPAWT